MMPITLIVRPKEFGRLLSHFQSTQTDVTVSFAPETDAAPGGDFAGGFGDKRGESTGTPARNLRLSSFSDPNAPPGQSLQTSISLDTAEDAILRYEHAETSGVDGEGPRGDAATDVTVNLKDLRAMVSFCESVDLDVALYADRAGAPVLVRPTAEFKGAHHQQHHYGGQRQRGGRECTNYSDVAALDFDAELVLASMLPRGDEAAEPTETLGGTRRGEGRDEDSFAPQGAFEGGGRRSEVTERGGAQSAAPSSSAAIPDSETFGSQPQREGEPSVGNATLNWAPGAPLNAAEEDDWDLGDAGDEFVEATPPEKRRKT
jgi:cell cycle checkpoint control protein RAD9A